MKGKTFGEVYPLGKCMVCLEPCSPEARLHYACAIIEEEKKKEWRKDDS